MAVWDDSLVFEDDYLEEMVASHILRHRIENYPEVAYSFEYCGESYCVLANSLLYTKSKDGTGMAGYLANHAIQGPVLDVADIKESYATDAVMQCSFGLFEGLGLLISHKNAIVTCVPPDMMPVFKAFFFGDSEYSVDTMDDRLQMTGLVQSNGTLKFSDSAKTLYLARLQQSDFAIGKDACATLPYGQFAEAFSISYNGKIVKSNVSRYWATDCGLTAKDFSGGYAFMHYNPPSAFNVQPLSIDFNDCIAFVNDSLLYVTVGNTMLKIQCDDVIKGKHDEFFVVINGTKVLEFALDPRFGISFHVPGFKLVNASGAECDWKGKKFSLAELRSLGLDSDMQDGFDITHNSNVPEPIQFDSTDPDKDADTTGKSVMSETAYEENSQLASAIEQGSRQIHGDNEFFRTKKIDELYRILNDRSIVF